MNKSTNLWAALACMALASCNQPASITGEFERMTATDSLIVSQNKNFDTIPAPDGKFTYNYQSDQAAILRLMRMPQKPVLGKQNAPMLPPVSVMVLPNTALHISGPFEKPVITGNKFYEEYNRFQEATAGMQREDLHAAIHAYISEHPTSQVSLFLLHQYHIKGGEDYLPKFDADIQQGATKDLYEDICTYYRIRAARQEAARNIVVGKQAPDFTLKDMDGNKFTLSSLRGKYVVLDFWGSWCGWCIKGMPSMKKMYEQYQDKLEIVSIACRDKEDKWRAAVKENQMNWTNVINSTEESEDLTIRYNIQFYPHKILLSPEGEILEIVPGEKPAFYTRVDEHLK